MSMEYERRGGGGGLGGCFSCYFSGGEESCYFSGGEEAEGAGEKTARALRRSSRWVWERTGELPELVARVGQQPRQRQQAAAAEEFRYDPISYALNFEEDGAGDDAGEEEQPFKYRAFSSRLPASPPLHAATAAATLDRGS